MREAFSSVLPFSPREPVAVALALGTSPGDDGFDESAAGVIPGVRSPELVGTDVLTTLPDVSAALITFDWFVRTSGSRRTGDATSLAVPIGDAAATAVRATGDAGPAADFFVPAPDVETAVPPAGTGAATAAGNVDATAKASFESCAPAVRSASFRAFELCAPACVFRAPDGAVFAFSAHDPTRTRELCASTPGAVQPPDVSTRAAFLATPRAVATFASAAIVVASAFCEFRSLPPSSAGVALPSSATPASATSACCAVPAPALMNSLRNAVASILVPRITRPADAAVVELAAVARMVAMFIRVVKVHFSRHARHSPVRFC